MADVHVRKRCPGVPDGEDGQDPHGPKATDQDTQGITRHHQAAAAPVPTPRYWRHAGSLRKRSTHTLPAVVCGTGADLAVTAPKAPPGAGLMVPARYLLFRHR